jgi:hypothetical protein
LPVKYQDALWHQGIKINPGDYDAEAFDETFQRINPRNLELIKNAQRQPLN